MLVSVKVQLVTIKLGSGNRTLVQNLIKSFFIIFECKVILVLNNITSVNSFCTNSQ